jgi:hypothetical protein
MRYWLYYGGLGIAEQSPRIAPQSPTARNPKQLKKRAATKRLKPKLTGPVSAEKR